MSVNEPCAGCWWKEGGRCYQDKLAHVHGMDKAPRNRPLFSGENGLEITGPLLDACLAQGFRKSKATVISRVMSALNPPQGRAP